MSRTCELTGIRPIVGNNVSHSRVHTKRRFKPNLVNVSLHSEILDRRFSLRIAARTLRTVDKLGGLDAFLSRARNETLSGKALKIKAIISQKSDDDTPLA